MNQLVPIRGTRTPSTARHWRRRLAVPAAIAGARDTAVRRFLEFFAATIRNKNTRAPRAPRAQHRDCSASRPSRAARARGSFPPVPPGRRRPPPPAVPSSSRAFRAPRAHCPDSSAYRPIRAVGRGSSNSGHPISCDGVERAIKSTTLSTVGVDVSLYLFRTAAASTAAIHSGENLHLGAALPHHTGLAIANEHYNRASSASESRASGTL
jgi:hypothetical protein